MFSKKIAILILILSISTFTLTGCLSKATPTQDNNNTETWTEQTAVQTQDVPSDDWEKMIKCEYTDLDWSITQAYIKWTVVYLETIDKATNKTTKWLSKDDKMYFWTDTDWRWFTIDLKAIESTDEKSSKSTQELIDKVQTWDNKCIQAKAPDSLFELPANINF